jgi:trigger factor
LFPTDNIETLEDFRKKFAQEMEKSYEGESENYFLNSAMENFVAKTEMEFPEEFLKRWLLAHNEGKITQEQIDLEFDSYLKSLKFQLIQNKIVTDFEIKVGEEEIRDHIRSYFKMQMPGGASEDEETVKRIESIVDSLIGNKEETQKITDQLYDQKIREALKGKVKLIEKTINYDDYIKMISNPK